MVGYNSFLDKTTDKALLSYSAAQTNVMLLSLSVSSVIAE